MSLARSGWNESFIEQESVKMVELTTILRGLNLSIISTNDGYISNLYDLSFIQPQANLTYQPQVFHLGPCSRHDYSFDNEMKQMQKATNDSDGHGTISCPDPVDAVTVCDHMIVHDSHLSCPHEKYTENAQDPSRINDGPQKKGMENSQHNQQQVQTTHLSSSHQQQ